MSEIHIVPVQTEKWTPPSVEDWVKEAEYKKKNGLDALAKRVRRLEILSAVSTAVYILWNIYLKWH